ncbi:MAG: hypothetical protein TREMPRED_002415 [Tremellales sp. Tagirdzhanova-0007]|nr:MAG: hypothetical protein TREMPRED_002415 [Tremellales sp. Tagirdzhanova-0007]
MSYCANMGEIKRLKDLRRHSPSFNPALRLAPTSTFSETRFLTELLLAEQRDFDDCLTLSTVRQSVADSNEAALIASARPVIGIPIRNDGPGLEEANEQQTV